MKTLKLFLVAGATVLILLLTPQPADAQSAGCNLIYQSGANSDAEPPGAPDGDCPRALPAIGSAVSLALALILVLLAAFRSFALGGLPVGATNVERDPSSTNRADFEKFVDGLLAEMGNPRAVDPDLNDLLKKVWRPNAQVGSGSTAAAVRRELATGELVGGKTHSQKAEELISALIRWLRNNPTATPGDRGVAQDVIRDLKNSLRGR